MADEDERSHCRTTTLMTNDSVVADAFRPYHKHISFAGGGRTRGLCEVLVTAVKEAPADHQRPTETQIKLVDQYHRNLGHLSRREFLKVLKAAHAKPAVLEHVRREYRCADCDGHTNSLPKGRNPTHLRVQPYQCSGCFRF